MYAHRIKGLSPSGLYLSNLEVSFLEQLFSSGMLQLPNLHSLHIALNDSSSRLIPNIWTFLSPKFISLEISLHKGSRIEKQFIRALQTLVDSLPMRTPNLQRLLLEGLVPKSDTDADAGWAFGNSLNRAAHGLTRTLTNLHTGHVGMELSHIRQILREANSLTTLETHLKSSSHHTAELMGVKAVTQLRQVILHVAEMADAIDFVTAIHASNLKRLNLRTTREIHSYIHALGTALLESGCSPSLTFVSIHWEDYQGQEEGTIFQTFLEPFFQFQKMNEFTITTDTADLVFHLDPSFLHAVVRCWPKIAVLDVCRTTPWDIWRPQIKLEDLVDLILALPSLTEISIDVDFQSRLKDTVSRPIPQHPHNSPDTLSIGVGLAIPEEPKDNIAAALSEIFRDDLDIFSSWSRERYVDFPEAPDMEIAWLDIQKTTYVMVKVRMQERHRAFPNM